MKYISRILKCFHYSTKLVRRFRVKSTAFTFIGAKGVCVPRDSHFSVNKALPVRDLAYFFILILATRLVSPWPISCLFRS